MSDGWRELSDSDLDSSEESESMDNPDQRKKVPKIEKAEDLKSMLETSFEKSGLDPVQKNLIDAAFSLIKPEEDGMIVAGWNEVLNLVESGETTKDPQAAAMKLIRAMLGAKPANSA